MANILQKIIMMKIENGLQELVEFRWRELGEEGEVRNSKRAKFLISSSIYIY